MKKALSIVFFVFLLSLIKAQAPQLINYQAVARNANGVVVNHQFISVEISIRDGSPTSSIIYQEIDTATTNQFGLFTVAIGGGQVQVGNLTAINWASGNKYVQVGFDATGGQNFANMGVSQLLSVPYALYAQSTTPIVTHQIGDLYQGGIIVAVWRDTNNVQHGLIASLTDISTSAVWSNISNTLIGTTAENAYDGAANTAAIIGQAGQTTSAALLCHNYNGGGYTDWYLPGFWELQQCYNEAMIVNNILGSVNGFQFIVYYWNSTEFSANNGGVIFFKDGTTGSSNKSNALSVRAVRRF